MFRSRGISCLVLLIALLGLGPAADAQDDFRPLLQQEPLFVSFSSLLANDTEPPPDLGSEIEVWILHGPISGILDPGIDGFTYYPPPDFFGVDSFRYRWISDSGPIEATVELFVAPWTVPLAGPMGLLDPEAVAAPEGLGYYNSFSGIFYFCPHLERASVLSCTSYRYPETQSGWLPFIGTWKDSKGHILPDRPGLFDPAERRVYLLDRSLTAPCTYCSLEEEEVTLPLRVIEQFELDEEAPRAAIPVAVNLGDGAQDTPIFFWPRELRFEGLPGPPATTSLNGPSLWPVKRAHADDVAGLSIFARNSGSLELLSGATVHFGIGLESLVTVRRSGPDLVYEVYDPSNHGLQKIMPMTSSTDPCHVDGTQILRFPSDPDPPPNGGSAPSCQEF